MVNKCKIRGILMRKHWKVLYKWTTDNNRFNSQFNMRRKEETKMNKFQKFLCRLFGLKPIGATEVELMVGEPLKDFAAKVRTRSRDESKSAQQEITALKEQKAKAWQVYQDATKGTDASIAIAESKQNKAAGPKRRWICCSSEPANTTTCSENYKPGRGKLLYSFSSPGFFLQKNILCVRR